MTTRVRTDRTARTLVRLALNVARPDYIDIYPREYGELATEIVAALVGASLDVDRLAQSVRWATDGVVDVSPELRKVIEAAVSAYTGHDDEFLDVLADQRRAARLVPA